MNILLFYAGKRQNRLVEIDKNLNGIYWVSILCIFIGLLYIISVVFSVVNNVGLGELYAFVVGKDIFAEDI